MKRETLDLIELAVEPYPDHAAQAADLPQRIRKELSANTAKADNESRIELWEMLPAEDAVYLVPSSYVGKRKEHLVGSSSRITKSLSMKTTIR